MEPPPRSIHILRPLGIVKGKELQAKLGGVLWLNACLRSHLEELLQAAVAEALDHSA